MLAIAVLSAFFQWVEPKPSHVEVGQPVRIEVRDAEGRPVAGVDIEIRWPDGRVEVIGTSDANGDHPFVPEAIGSYRVSAQHEGVVLLAPFRAAEPARRGWYAALCVPLGIALVWLNLRRR